MPIRLLPESVASRIAAGEVVERPASVVKELLENSLDAGSTRIDIETQDGGATLIRIHDNGTGIPAAEVALAFRRHATSKLETADDLEAIATLGFRGEALSSIASVSRTTCVTRHTSETAGTRLRIEGGEIVSHTSVGRPSGTELIVEDLFYNVPARRKFMRSAQTERRHIDSFTTRYAIAYPSVAFTAVHDGREVLRSPGTGDPREVLLSIYGTDLGASLLTVPEDYTADQPIEVRGFVAPTTVHRANRGYITLFINGRWVEDLRLTYAIIQAYHTLLPVNRFPVAFVLVTVPPGDVDVNVHPAKSEVRFRDADTVFRAVQRAVRATVVNEAPVASSWSAGETVEPAGDASTRTRLAALQPSQGHITFPPITRGEAPQASGLLVGANSAGGLAPSSRPQSTSGQFLPPLRIVGQVATMFIVAEGPDGLYLIDQHAAHERVLYERLVSGAATGTLARQPLLDPEIVTLPADEAGRLEELLPSLGDVGVEAEVFGPNTFLVRALPAELGMVSSADLLADIAAVQQSSSPIRSHLEESLIRHICKRAAIKAGQVLSLQEMDRLVKDLERTGNPRTCPHGRPTIVEIPTEDLARRFGRPGV
ncbi:MAG: DNA mismatch repair endonuclease MutL [Anaerolineae bacterium]|jgi:DNA mismatch repair protein MutL|nr:DNA mismatch repair endonuclease MutL [Anaerolineae bacterium]